MDTAKIKTGIYSFWKRTASFPHVTIVERLIDDGINEPFSLELCKLEPTMGGNEANAELICEAFNVANETGLSPKQMRDRIVELENLNEMKLAEHSLQRNKEILEECTKAKQRIEELEGGINEFQVKYDENGYDCESLIKLKRIEGQIDASFKIWAERVDEFEEKETYFKTNRRMVNHFKQTEMKTLEKTMAQFVLEQATMTFKNKGRWDEVRFYNILNYAKLLSTPLTLGMFICVDDDGNVLEEPKNVNYQTAKMFEIATKRYQKALSNVLFDGFEIDFEEGNIFPFIDSRPIGFLNNDDKWVLCSDFKTIEDLIRYELKLTDNFKL